MSKWLLGLLVIVVLFVVGYYTGIINFSGSVDVTENGKVVYEAGTESEHGHSH